MKKNYVALISMVLLLMNIGGVYAQTMSATSSATNATSSGTVNANTDLQNLKDKVASKVAELRKKDQKATAGIVISTGTDVFKIRTNDDTEYQIKKDDTLTKVYQIIGTQKKEIQFKDVKKDAYSIVTGPLIDKTITANFVYLDEEFIVKTGKITEVNKTDYYIKVLSTEKDTYTLDIEASTKQQMLNVKTLEIEKVGFSKIKEGDSIHFVVKKTGKEKEKNRFAAQKILIIPQEYFMK